jgi:hypothetical protein
LETNPDLSSFALAGADHTRFLETTKASLNDQGFVVYQTTKEGENWAGIVY